MPASHILTARCRNWPRAKPQTDAELLEALRHRPSQGASARQVTAGNDSDVSPNRNIILGFQSAGIEKVFYLSRRYVGARSNQPRIGGPFERFSAPFRDLVERFGSVVKLLIVVNVVVFFIQLFANAAHVPYVEQYFALSAEGIPPPGFGVAVRDLYVSARVASGTSWVICFSCGSSGAEVEYFIGPKYFTR